MKALYYTIVLLLCTSGLRAQTEADALRYSRIFPFGSARVTAMGGAFGALGGDLSVATMNPGGIGVFRNSEISFTSVLDFTHSKSGNRNMEKNPYLIGNLGFVIAFHPIHEKWKNINFAFNYTNLNNFNRNIYQGGDINDKNSLLDVWLMEANGNDRNSLNEFTTSLAYDAYLIKLQPESKNQYEIPIVAGDSMRQSNYIRERGFQGEYALSVGANYDDKLYLGATLGIQNIHYKHYSTYTEIVEGKEIDSKLMWFDFVQDYTTSGVGINFKVGAIYRPIPQLRLGLAIHTPTYYSLTDKVTNGAYSQFIEPPAGEKETQWGNHANTSFDYNLKTPWRFIASIATVLGQRAILSVDYEFVDYSSSKLSGGDGTNYYGTEDVNGDYIPGANDMIKEVYRNTNNLRAGAEFRVSSVLSLRGGYSYTASPYKKGELNEKNNVQTVSGGLGLNFNSLYVDLAYMRKYSKEQSLFYAYKSIESPVIQTKYQDNQFRLTVGVRF
ncbi:OmpP1/FadL family transporter [Gabonibacter massiliensis]|uniref:OmpP1/FadL family transporter n=1 Tax=Gabonibacter massiliensis TaxID=1720195 RepID=UPI00073F6C95|nr:outer membrane protein transport protein [Gabonibacter massiliensis]